MKSISMFVNLLVILVASLAQATVYTGVMDNRAGQQFIPGMTAQSKAWTSGGNPGEGVRLEWQVDNVYTPGSWTYSYRLLRGNSKNKGFAFFDIETASDFSAANILNKQVTWALNRVGSPIQSGLAAVTISDPVNFNAVHDFSNAAVTEASAATALSKSELSHYSGDPGRVPPGQPGLDASYTPSVGPVPHPFFGIRVTFPGSFANLSYEASEWEFKIVSDRPPMWGSFFGWGDQTSTSPYWYSNMYNSNIDNTVRLTLPPASCSFGESPYQGWILVPGPQPAAQSSFLTVDLASYSRDFNGGGQINMFASALANPNLNLTVSGAGIASPVVMSRDIPNPILFGKYLAHIPFTSLPASVQLDNSVDPVTLPPYQVPLVDEVRITQAVFNSLTRTMTIKASSQDRMVPLPILAAVDFAAPNQFDVTGTFSKTLTANPPNSITVISSKGGSATAKVSIASAIAAPIAADDLLTTTLNTAMTINVTANDSATTPAIINPASVAIVNFPANGTLATHADGTITYMPKLNFSGADNFTYTVQDSLGSLSNVATVSIQVTTPLPTTGATLFTNVPSPQFTGTSITFVAQGQGGTGIYEYEFWQHNGLAWSKVQSFSTNSSWTWDTSTAVGGIYTIQANVRSSGSTATFEAFKAITFTVNTASTATGATLVPDKSSPQPINTPGGITYTAQGQGGSGSYEYEFWLHNGVNWTKVQSYSANGNWVWNTALASPGIYTVQVNVKSAGSAAAYETYRAGVFELQ